MFNSRRPKLLHVIIFPYKYVLVGGLQNKMCYRFKFSLLLSIKSISFVKKLIKSNIQFKLNKTLLYYHTTLHKLNNVQFLVY